MLPGRDDQHCLQMHMERVWLYYLDLFYSWTACQGQTPGVSFLYYTIRIHSFWNAAWQTFLCFSIEYTRWTFDYDIHTGEKSRKHWIDCIFFFPIHWDRPRPEDDSDESDSELEFYYSEVEVTRKDFPHLFDDDAMQQWPLSPSQAVVVGSVQEHHLSCNVGTMRNSMAMSPPHAYANFHASSAPTISHMDMARPPHENPDLQQSPVGSVHRYWTNFSSN
jgi:hypothetical protein